MTERSLTLELESALETLSKAVFSQPIDKTADAKISVRPLLLRGERMFQAEIRRGAQAFHENLSAEVWSNAAGRTGTGATARPCW